jgi:hypothetical protein
LSLICDIRCASGRSQQSDFVQFVALGADIAGEHPLSFVNEQADRWSTSIKVSPRADETGSNKPGQRADV